MAKLTIIDRKSGKQRALNLDSEHFSVGKKETNDLILNRGNISRDHCEIFRQNGKYMVRDLGSRNGTYLNGNRLDQNVTLKTGDKIFVGDFCILYSDVKGEFADIDRAGKVTKRDESRLVPVEIKREIHERLLEKLDLKHTSLDDDSDEKLRARTVEITAEIVNGMRGKLPSWLKPKDLVKEIVDEALGLGPIEPLLADSEVDEIMVNGWDKIYVERFGKLELTNKRFTDNRQIMEVIRRILAPIGKRIDETSPLVDARLRDGSRVNAIIPPLCLTGPTITIRKFSEDPFTTDDLVGFGSFSKEIARFFEFCVTSRKNILISGGTGSGKTTLLNVLSLFIPENERIVTVEDAAELRLSQDHVISLESKPANIEGEGAIPIRQLVINCLRMRPDRIVVGECRGGEALDMLQAMNTGHDGSLTTLHANSTRDALARIETMVLMAGTLLPSRAIREQVVSAIDMIIHISRISDGTRKLVSVREVVGMEQDTITLREIFKFIQTGYGAKGKVEGYFTATGEIPDFVHELRKAGKEIDLGIFKPVDEKGTTL